MKKILTLNSEQRVAFVKYFVFFFVVFQALAWWISSSIHAQTAIANLVSWLYQLLGFQVLQQGNLLIDPVSGRYVIVDHQCTGFALIGTLSALWVSLPFSFKQKVCGVCLFVVLIQFENAIRIMHLYQLMSENNTWFNFYHFYLWQGVNFIYAIGVFYFVSVVLIIERPQIGSISEDC